MRRAAFLRSGPVVTCVLILAGAASSLAESRRAHVFIGLTANETQAARLLDTARAIERGLAARGIPPSAITLRVHSPDAPLRREHILAALSPPPGASAGDDTWLVLLGTAAPDRAGRPAFQVAGPRLSAGDLASVLATLPGRKHVAVLSSSSGGFLPPLLALPEVEAVAATTESGQVGEPRFAAFWADALAATPQAPFAEIAASAADRVDTYYAEHSIAQGETARLLDRASGRILEAPFRDALAASATGSARAAGSPAGPTPAVNIAEIRIPRPSAGADEIERRPADEESLALLAAARAAMAAHLEHAALLLRTEAEVTVARDFSSRETWRVRAYLRTGEALDEFGSLHLPFDPPFVASQLVSARVIRPDGAQLLLNPAARSARLAAASSPGSPDPDPTRDRPPPSWIELPEVTADCVVEAEWTTDRRTDGALPAFYHEWFLARAHPQLSLRFVLSLPKESDWRVRSPAALSGAMVNNTHHFDLSDIPAHQPLPHDPPARSTQPWIGLSSLATWDGFADWYRRLAAGSETAGPTVEALATEIAAAHPDRAGRLRAAYEHVAALRYVTTPLGVAAFRPRTPEQTWRERYGDCKDKANLLVAVLTRLGILAEFALVNRFETTFTDFPGWQFNHALARVPAAPAAGQPHDLWLDATDRLVPFEVVAPGNLGRQALVFSPGFARAEFHLITAAQEPGSTWTESFTPASDDTHRIQISATGSAGLALRRLLLGQNPQQRLYQLSTWLGAPVSALDFPDPYDLSRPFALSFTTTALPATLPRPLAPGLASYLLPADRPRVWDEGREWTYTRITPSGTTTQSIPARLP
jgi:transglutaminase-like putative cysteine protease